MSDELGTCDKLDSEHFKMDYRSPHFSHTCVNWKPVAAREDQTSPTRGLQPNQCLICKGAIYTEHPPERFCTRCVVNDYASYFLMGEKLATEAQGAAPRQVQHYFCGLCGDTPEPCEHQKEVKNAGAQPPQDARDGIYVASRASIPARSEMWRKLRHGGIKINATWIDEAEENATQSFSELWSRIEGEIKSSAGLVLYAESDDFPLKGALVEVGMALAMGIRVIVVAPGVQMNPRNFKPFGSWAKHPLVTFEESLGIACRQAARSTPSPDPPQKCQTCGSDDRTGATYRFAGVLCPDPWHVTPDSPPQIVSAPTSKDLLEAHAILALVQNVQQRRLEYFASLKDDIAQRLAEYASSSNAAPLEVLKKACDREWKDENLYQAAVIAANGIYWRDEEISELRSERDGLREALLNYGNHRIFCTMHVWLASTGGPTCNCGWEEVLARLGTESTEKG